MRNKSCSAFVEQAFVHVPDFEHVVRKLESQVTLRRQSKSTLGNYIRCITLFVVHFGKFPKYFDPEEINEYLPQLPEIPENPHIPVPNVWFNAATALITMFIQRTIVAISIRSTVSAFLCQVVKSLSALLAS